MTDLLSCISARTIQSWIDTIIDLGEKPHIVVNQQPCANRQYFGAAAKLAPANKLFVPYHVEKDGVSIWNLSPTSVHEYYMDYINGILFFAVRIQGKKHSLCVPIEHITNVFVPDRNINVQCNTLSFCTKDASGSFYVSSAGGDSVQAANSPNIDDEVTNNEPVGQTPPTMSVITNDLPEPPTTPSTPRRGHLRLVK